MKISKATLEEIEDALYRSVIAGRIESQSYCGLTLERGVIVCIAFHSDFDSIPCEVAFVPVRKLTRKKSVEAAAQMIASKVIPGLRRLELLRKIADL